MVDQSDKQPPAKTAGTPDVHHDVPKDVRHDVPHDTPTHPIVDLSKPAEIGATFKAAATTRDSGAIAPDGFGLEDKSAQTSAKDSLTKVLSGLNSKLELDPNEKVSESGHIFVRPAAGATPAESMSGAFDLASKTGRPVVYNEGGMQVVLPVPDVKPGASEAELSAGKADYLKKAGASYDRERLAYDSDNRASEPLSSFYSNRFNSDLEMVLHNDQNLSLTPGTRIEDGKPIQVSVNSNFGDSYPAAYQLALQTGKPVDLALNGFPMRIEPKVGPNASAAEQLADMTAQKTESWGAYNRAADAEEAEAAKNPRTEAGRAAKAITETLSAPTQPPILDAQGRVAEVKTPNGSNKFAYDETGLKQVTFDNGLVLNRDAHNPYQWNTDKTQLKGDAGSLGWQQIVGTTVLPDGTVSVTFPGSGPPESQLVHPNGTTEYKEGFKTYGVTLENGYTVTGSGGDQPYLVTNPNGEKTTVTDRAQKAQIEAALGDRFAFQGQDDPTLRPVREGIRGLRSSSDYPERTGRTQTDSKWNVTSVSTPSGDNKYEYDAQGLKKATMADGIEIVRDASDPHRFTTTGNPPRTYTGGEILGDGSASFTNTNNDGKIVSTIFHPNGSEEQKIGDRTQSIKLINGYEVSKNPGEPYTVTDPKGAKTQINDASKIDNIRNAFGRKPDFEKVEASAPVDEAKLSPEVKSATAAIKESLAAPTEAPTRDDQGRIKEVKTKHGSTTFDYDESGLKQVKFDNGLVLNRNADNPYQWSQDKSQITRAGGPSMIGEPVGTKVLPDGTVSVTFPGSGPPESNLFHPNGTTEFKEGVTSYAVKLDNGLAITKASGDSSPYSVTDATGARTVVSDLADKAALKTALADEYNFQGYDHPVLDKVMDGIRGMPTDHSFPQRGGEPVTDRQGRITSVDTPLGDNKYEYDDQGVKRVTLANGLDLKRDAEDPHKFVFDKPTLADSITGKYEFSADRFRSFSNADVSILPDGSASFAQHMAGQVRTTIFHPNGSEELKIGDRTQSIKLVNGYELSKNPGEPYVVKDPNGTRTEVNSASQIDNLENMFGRKLDFETADNPTKRAMTAVDQGLSFKASEPTRDRSGRVTSVDSPDGPNKFKYDSDGLLKRITLANGLDLKRVEPSSEMPGAGTKWEMDKQSIIGDFLGLYKGASPTSNLERYRAFLNADATILPDGSASITEKGTGQPRTTIFHPNGSEEHKVGDVTDSVKLPNGYEITHQPGGSYKVRNPFDSSATELSEPKAVAALEGKLGQQFSGLFETSAAARGATAQQTDELFKADARVAAVTNPARDVTAEGEVPAAPQADFAAFKTAEAVGSATERPVGVTELPATLSGVVNAADWEALAEPQRLELAKKVAAMSEGQRGTFCEMVKARMRGASGKASAVAMVLGTAAALVSLTSNANGAPVQPKVTLSSE